MLNVATNFVDDSGHPRDSYFGINFSKLDQHDVWDLLSAATYSLILKLKVNILK